MIQLTSSRNTCMVVLNNSHLVLHQPPAYKHDRFMANNFSVVKYYKFTLLITAKNNINMSIRSMKLGLQPSLVVIQRSLLHKSAISLAKPLRTGYNSSDSTIDTDDILTENNPWSPTLLEDSVSYRRPFLIRSRELPSNFRLSYQPIYESPSGRYVGILKRITLSFAFLGAYGAKMFYDSPNFDDMYAAVVFVGCLLPVTAVQFKTKDYVTRIFRLYDKEKPQNLENLVNDERLIMEKLTWNGGKTYNQLLTVSGNKSLQLAEDPAHTKTFVQRVLSPYATWKEVDVESKFPRSFYVADDVGGLKMDRLWGIVEHNSSVNNGRYIEVETDAGDKQ